ncbi:hypothetical protein O181_070897, partial [Austropuccinia psidii MF-1]|nr:hypothetical protein [Austropuccinia psidii MF-1]
PAYESRTKRCCIAVQQKCGGYGTDDTAIVRFGECFLGICLHVGGIHYQQHSKRENGTFNASRNTVQRETANRQDLDDRAHKGHVVIYLQRAKGWLFYVPGANKMIPSAWATFPGSSQLTTMLRKGQPFEPQKKEANNKMGIPFLLNNLRLGDFSREKKFAEQEQTAAKIAKPSDVIPRTYKEAMRSHESEEWSRAIEEELQNMKRMDVFEVAPLDKMQHTINGGWIFAKKINNLSGQVRYKARYVARGNKQCYNKEYRETFALTATFSALRLLLTWAAKHNWLVHSFDFTAAYLNAPMDMEVWIKPPDGMNVPPNMGCRLKKALYGTRQAGRCLWEHLGGRLKALGFSKSAFNNSVYFNFRNNAMTWIHVDDGVVIAQTKNDLDDLKQGLERSFLIKWKEGVENMIGMEIERQAAGFTLNQKRLIESIISKHWDGKRANATPLPAKSKVYTMTRNDQITDQKSFLSIVGSLSYVANGTRPDISFAVNLLARHAQAPGRQHWAMLQHLLGYLHQTQRQGLRLFPNDEEIAVSSDASWGGEFSRSTHGYLLMVHGCAIAWSSKRLAMVAASTSNAEYMALSLASRQGMWMRRLIRDVFGKSMRLLLLCDNESAIKISKDSVSNKRTRHSDRDFYIVNEMLYNKEAELEWVCTRDMKANGLTKSLGPLLHQQFCSHFLS